MLPKFKHGVVDLPGEFVEGASITDWSNAEAAHALSDSISRPSFEHNVPVPPVWNSLHDP